MLFGASKRVSYDTDREMIYQKKKRTVLHRSCGVEISPKMQPGRPEIFAVLESAGKI